MTDEEKIKKYLKILNEEHPVRKKEEANKKIIDLFTKVKTENYLIGRAYENQAFKDKIKEKIEELDKQVHPLLQDGDYMLLAQINVLENLLGE